jgi:hypothetical protein
MELVTGAELEAVQNGTTLTLRDGLVRLVSSDGLYEKTLVPIPRGGLARGWIRFFVKCKQPTELFSTGSQWMVSFEDFKGVRV